MNRKFCAYSYYRVKSAFSEQVTTPNLYSARWAIYKADEATTPQFLCGGRGVRLLTRERCLECRVRHVLCVEPRKGGVIRLQSRHISMLHYFFDWNKLRSELHSDNTKVERQYHVDFSALDGCINLGSEEYICLHDKKNTQAHESTDSWSILVEL